MSQSPKLTHIPILNYLRGFAALSVCLFHFSYTKGFLSDSDTIYYIGSFGKLGVQSFFVISGFLIPYSLHLRSYRVRDAGAFLIRRLKRLEPPYFCCIAFTLSLNYFASLTPGFRGEPLDFSLGGLIAHFAYLNAILNLDYGWINPVFWTLAIEFQYYIFVALVFPLLNNKNWAVRTVSLLTIASLGTLGPDNFALLPHWLPLFAIGMATYQFMVGHCSKFHFATVLFIVLGISFVGLEIQEIIIATLTAFIILAFGSKTLPDALRPLGFAGTISYSLYLVHYPIGVKVVNILNRFMPSQPIYHYIIIIVAFMVSIFCAWLFWMFVEKPSHLWAKGISQKSNSLSEEIEQVSMSKP